MTLARYHTGTKAKTLQFLWECKRQNPDIADLMSEIEDEDDVKKWDVAVLKCRICNKRQIAIMPCEIENTDSECPNCENMTADVIEDNDVDTD